MANKRKDGPHWVKAWIADLSMLTDSFRDMNTGAVNFEALGKEEYLFRMALSRKDFSLSNRAKKVWEEAVGPYNQRITAANKKSPQDAPNGNAGVDMSDAGNGAASKSPTSCDQFTADGDIREDSQAKPDGSAITRNETRAHDALEPSANHYGDAPRREAGEAFTSRESGAAVPTTVSNNSEARQIRRTDGSSVRGMAKVAQPSVRSRASFRNKEDFIQWAIDDGLDPVDANECWEATEERGGKDADGNTVKNMKAFARQWCRTRANNRRTA